MTAAVLCAALFFAGGCAIHFHLHVGGDQYTSDQKPAKVIVTAQPAAGDEIQVTVEPADLLHALTKPDAE